MTQMEIAKQMLNERIAGLQARFEADVMHGMMDAKGGVYDKWYRHHRSDNGAAYDAGWMSAKEEGKDYQIIEG